MALAVMPVPPHLLPAQVVPDEADGNFTHIPHHLQPQHHYPTSPSSDRSRHSERQSRNGSTHSSPRGDKASLHYDPQFASRPFPLLTPPWPSPALLAPTHLAHPSLQHGHYPQPLYDSARVPLSPYHHPPPLHIIVPPSPLSPAFAPMFYHPPSAPTSRRVSTAGLPSPPASCRLSTPNATHLANPATADPYSEKDVPPASATTSPAYSKTQRKSTSSQGLHLSPSADKEDVFDEGEEVSLSSSRQSSTRNHHHSAPHIPADLEVDDERGTDETARDARDTAKALIYLSSCAPLISFAWALYTIVALLFLAIASPVFCCVRRRSQGVFSGLATSALAPFLSIQLACSGSSIRPPTSPTSSSTRTQHNDTSVNVTALVLAALGSPFISLVLAVSGVIMGFFWLLNMVIMETEKGVDDGKMLADKVVALWIGWLVWPLRTSTDIEQRTASRRHSQSV